MNLSSGNVLTDDQSYERKFYKVVLTGGPCAGKTSALAVISGRNVIQLYETKSNF